MFILQAALRFPPKTKIISKKVKNKMANLSESPDITGKVSSTLKLDFCEARWNAKQISFHDNFHDFATGSHKTKSQISPKHKTSIKDVDNCKCNASINLFGVFLKFPYTRKSVISECTEHKSSYSFFLETNRSSQTRT